jgi:hypothetical protein
MKCRQCYSTAALVGPGERSTNRIIAYPLTVRINGERFFVGGRNMDESKVIDLNTDYLHFHNLILLKLRPTTIRFGKIAMKDGGFFNITGLRMTEQSDQKTYTLEARTSKIDPETRHENFGLPFPVLELVIREPAVNRIRVELSLLEPLAQNIFIEILSFIGLNWPEAIPRLEAISNILSAETSPQFLLAPRDPPGRPKKQGYVVAFERYKEELRTCDAKTARGNAYAFWKDNFPDEFRQADYNNNAGKNFKKTMDRYYKKYKVKLDKKI